MHLQLVQLNTQGLDSLKAFYTQTLGFSLTSEGQNSFAVQCGNSQLQFVQNPIAAYYHFAFNIPSFQIQEATNWLKNRTPILPGPTEEIVDFPNWNAQSVYFKDPAGNILEFIARKNLKIEHTNPFSVNSILNISEIGIPVLHIEKEFSKIQQQTDLPLYWGDLKRFSAIGTENGLFIVVDETNKTWYPTNIPANSFPMDIHFRFQEQSYRLQYKSGDLAIETREA